uniref:Uncharacterized protein n=1 Tax=Arundo donax TaxID=35708 RepID=A0A0A8Y921_ARUDO
MSLTTSIIMLIFSYILSYYFQS